VLTGFLAPEQGAIARFLGNTLAGALVQEGDQWLPSPTLQNAAPFDADFLNAVNALSRLSSLLYAEGDAAYPFELRPVAMPGLAETTLMIDGQALKYFNQHEAWLAMHWPQTGQPGGTYLQWLSLATGTRQTLEFSGSWAFIRLLEKARVVQLDKARFQLDFALPDGLTARYILRTNAGEGHWPCSSCCSSSCRHGCLPCPLPQLPPKKTSAPHADGMNRPQQYGAAERAPAAPCPVPAANLFHMLETDAAPDSSQGRITKTCL
jgi:type VI protein secretion system component VasK